MRKIINKKFLFCIFIIIIFLLTIIIVFKQRDGIAEIYNSRKMENTQDIEFEIYSNENNILNILVKSKENEYGIKTVKYKNKDGKDIEINGNGKREIALDYEISKDGNYDFSMINNNGDTVTKTLNVNDNFRKTYSNLNITNIKSYEADSFYSTKNNGIYIGNPPCNALDNDMTTGNGRNWYGGTKLLIEYKSISTIVSTGIYTTWDWGNTMDSATLYYAEDDTLTMDSNLNDFKSITVDTDKIYKLPEKIKAKRIMLIKNDQDSVYEFKCFGGYQEGDWMPNLNLNYINRKMIKCDGYSGENKPENVVDNSFADGNGKNWYGGTKLLISYNTLSTITSIGVYTTDNWGKKMSSITLYYSEDDSLTLSSDLSKFNSISIETDKKIILPEAIKTKRVLITKNSKEAVYEFQCLGTYSDSDIVETEYKEKSLKYPVMTSNGMMNVKYENPFDSNEFYYGFDKDWECTATDALDKAAYDGDDSTYYDGTSNKNKFYFGDDFDIYNVCFKIDSNYTGIVYNWLENSGYIAVGEGSFIENGVFHTTRYGKNSDAWKNTFCEIKTRLYEVYYNKNL